MAENVDDSSKCGNGRKHFKIDMIFQLPNNFSQTFVFLLEKSHVLVQFKN